MKLKTKGKRGSIPQLFPKEFQSKSQNLMFEMMCSNISSIYQWCILQIRNQGREAPSMFFLREQTSQGKVRKTISRALAKLLPFTTFFSYYGSLVNVTTSPPLPVRCYFDLWADVRIWSRCSLKSLGSSVPLINMWFYSKHYRSSTNDTSVNIKHHHLEIYHNHVWIKSHIN